MSLGMEVYADDGATVFSSDGAVARMVANIPVAAGESGSYTVSGNVGEIYAFAVATTATVGSYMVPNVHVSGSTISWEPTYAAAGVFVYGDFYPYGGSVEASGPAMIIIMAKL